VPTLRTLVAGAAERLSLGPHPDRARQDAETLLLRILNKTKAWLITHPDKELTDFESGSYTDFIARRQRGEPIQYIIGETEFYRLPFLVTPDVLIPRPETELLVECASQLIPTFDNRPSRLLQFRKIHQFRHAEKRSRDGDPNSTGWPPRVLDIGTGSGAIAISIAHDWSEAEITAIDSSAAALDVARSNAKRLGFANQIRFLQGDLLAPVAEEKFDIVVSNPPYVPSTDRDSLAVEVRDHEPALALFAGPGGLDIYRRLIPQAFASLATGGFIALEIGYGQSQPISDLLTASGFQKIEFVPDLQSIPRVAVAQHP
jgi:release factor glutamine methyltransferase